MKLYTQFFAMAAEKNISISFRVSPCFKHLLEASAAREHRSQTNKLETLLFSYSDEHGIALPQEMPTREAGKGPGRA